MIEKALVPVLAALVLPGIVPCFFSGQLSPQYFVEIWQQFLWTALTAIFCWDLAAIFLISSSSNILVRFGSNSLWAAVISLDGFDSNILVWFGSNSLWAALVAIFWVRFGSNFSGRLWQKYFGEIRQQFSLGSSRSNFLLRLDSNFYFWLALAAIFWWAWAALAAIFLVRFGNNFSGHIWQQYFGEIRHQFSLGSCGNNIWCDNNLPDVEIIYLVWKPGISEAMQRLKLWKKRWSIIRSRPAGISSLQGTCPYNPTARHTSLPACW